MALGMPEDAPRTIRLPDPCATRFGMAVRSTLPSIAMLAGARLPIIPLALVVGLTALAAYARSTAGNAPALPVPLRRTP